MNARNRTLPAAGLIAALLALAPCAAPAVPITKAASGTDLAAGASWTGGTAPDSGNVASITRSGPGTEPVRHRRHSHDGPVRRSVSVADSPCGSNARKCQ